MHDLAARFENAVILKQNERPKPTNKWSAEIPVAVIGPNGEFNVTFFDPKVLERNGEQKLGMTHVVFADGEFFVPGWARTQGWVLYKSMCSGDLAGAEASPKHWKLWKRLCAMLAAGKTPRRDSIEPALEKLGVDGLFHPEVYRRRKEAAAGGGDTLDVDAVVRWLKDGADDDADEADLDLDGEDDEPILRPTARRRRRTTEAATEEN